VAVGWAMTPEDTAPWPSGRGRRRGDIMTKEATVAKDPQRLDVQLCFALFSAHRAMMRAYTPLLQPLGLTYPGYLIMLALWESATVKEDELAARLTLTLDELAPLLDSMHAQGLVKRSSAFDEEGAGVVRITPAGQAKKEQMRFVPETMACRVGIASDADAERLGRLRTELRDLTSFLQRFREE
jgi:DNA-binding MarR family transcriptional regulator